jgi:DNA-binding NarL/FixJ family response regulator
MIQVLLADDHAIVRDGLRVLLEAAGDIVVIASVSNGREAVASAERSCPDVAILDVSMPVMGGIEATRQIQIQCPETQVLMLSMHHTFEYIHNCLKAGAKGYVLKDSAGSELVVAVRSVHEGERYFSQQVSALARRFLDEQN